MKNTAQPVGRTTESREDRYTDELFAKLESRGCILFKSDRRLIRQAFERHFREVFSAAIAKARP